jgi:hypothetical protein
MTNNTISAREGNRMTARKVVRFMRRGRKEIQFNDRLENS